MQRTTKLRILDVSRKIQFQIISPIVPLSCLVKPVLLWVSEDAISNKIQVTTEVLALISL